MKPTIFYKEIFISGQKVTCQPFNSFYSGFQPETLQENKFFAKVYEYAPQHRTVKTDSGTMFLHIPYIQFYFTEYRSVPRNNNICSRIVFNTMSTKSVLHEDHLLCRSIFTNELRSGLICLIRMMPQSADEIEIIDYFWNSEFDCNPVIEWFQSENQNFGSKFHKYGSLKKYESPVSFVSDTLIFGE